MTTRAADKRHGRHDQNPATDGAAPHGSVTYP